MIGPEHVLAKRVGVRRHHRMKKNAELHAVRFGEERAILRRREWLAADVAEQDHAVEF